MKAARSQGNEMPTARKLFRIEVTQGASATGADGGVPDALLRHDEIMAELRALRSIIEPQGLTEQLIDAHRTEIAEARKLKAELDSIYEAINRTKREIASLHVAGFESSEMVRVADQLDAVVNGTQGATEQILSSAEFIDQAANSLAAALKGEHDRALANDIQEHVIQIFEACNFQDLTGQRISKVVAALKFIECHVVRMMEIWGGIESFQDLTPIATGARGDDGKLINGPRLDGDLGHASQDEIDALFA
jgi:chemotaxis protein CheZ